MSASETRSYTRETNCHSSNSELHGKKKKVVKTCHYLLSSALHDLCRNSVDFVVHLYRSPFPTANPNKKYTEVCPTEVQSKKISIFYVQGEN